VKCGNGRNTITSVTDGTSYTIIVGEDSSYRNHRTLFPFQSSTASDPFVNKGADPGNISDGQGFRAIKRWAEPENGNGVSGPPSGDPASPFNTGTPGPYVNQNASPLGGGANGGAGCTWAVNNCGPNDE